MASSVPLGTESLVQLTYVSTSTGLYSSQQIQDILGTSRRNNALTGITGMLIYEAGNIMQVLEGEEAAVHRLFDVIERDPRHHDVTRLFVWPAAQRSFPGWSMAYREFDPASGAPRGEHHELFTLGYDFSKLEPERVRKMVQTFVRSLRTL